MRLYPAKNVTPQDPKRQVKVDNGRQQSEETTWDVLASASSKDNSGCGKHGNAPHGFEPGLEFVFFNTCRMVSRAMLSTRCSSTSLSASSCNVQCSCPSSGGLHTSAIRCASCPPSSLRSRGLRGRRRVSAECNPSSTNRSRTRSTVAVPTSSASTSGWIAPAWPSLATIGSE